MSRELLAFVVDDEWQRELVYRAARRHRLEDQVYQPVYFGDTGGWGWERRLEASPWVEKQSRALDVLSQRPGATLALVRQALDQSSRGRAAQNAGRTLHDLGLIDRLWHGGKRRCRTGPKGR